MGWAYSVDLRERVIAAFDAGDMTGEQVAAFFRIGEATGHRWKRLKRETGSLERRPGGGGNPPRVGPEKYDLVCATVEEKPDATDQEVACEFHRRTGQSVSRSSMNPDSAEAGAHAKEEDPDRDRAGNTTDPGTAP